MALPRQPVRHQRQLAFTDSAIYDSLLDRPCGLNATSRRLVSLRSECGANGPKRGPRGSARHPIAIGWDTRGHESRCASRRSTRGATFTSSARD